MFIAAHVARRRNASSENLAERVTAYCGIIRNHICIAYTRVSCFVIGLVLLLALTAYFYSVQSFLLRVNKSLDFPPTYMHYPLSTLHQPRLVVSRKRRVGRIAYLRARHAKLCELFRIRVHHAFVT